MAKSTKTLDLYGNTFSRSDIKQVVIYNAIITITTKDGWSTNVGKDGDADNYNRVIVFLGDD